MRYQDQIVRSTQKAMEDVVRASLAVPSESVDWVPMGCARSVLSQMQEIATTGDFFLPIIRERAVPEFDEHAMKEAIRIRRSHDTLEKCVQATRNSVSELCQAISEFPNEALEDEISMPFGGGVVMTMSDVLALPSWNMVYHLGQINQIQLMLGDREMH